MRERFKGTGSLKLFKDTMEKEEEMREVSKEKKEVLDLWNPDDLDEHDKRALFEKYSISEKDLDMYYGRISDKPKNNFADDEEIKRLRRKTSISGNIDKTLENRHEKALTTVTGMKEGNKIPGVFEAAASGMTVSGLRRPVEENGIKNNRLISEDIKKTETPELVQYHVKDMNIQINNEKQDPKNIRFDIKKILGEHDRIFIDFEIDSSLADKYVTIAYMQDQILEIELNRMKENKGEEDFKRIFYGLITKAEVLRTAGEFFKVTLEGASISILMDKIKKYRVWQDTEMTYEEIIKEIFAEYTGEVDFHIEERLKRPLNHMLIQSNETDWEFLKRILSDIGEEGIPVISHLNSVLLGIIETTVYKTNLSNSEIISGRDNKNRYFRIKGTDPYNPGEKVTINIPKDEDYGTRLVYNSRMWIEENIIQCEYTVISAEKEKGYIFPLIQNKELKGMLIEGTVIEVGSTDGIAVMTIDLSSGLSKFINRNTKVYPDKYPGKWKFPYKTPYSQSNTGFEPTPETGDIVVVSFQGMSEKLSYVEGCVNNPGNGRFSDRDNRNFGSSPSANGEPMFNFKLSSEVFSVSVTDFIGLTATNSIAINATSGDITETAQNSIKMTVPSGSVDMIALNTNVTGMDTVNITGMNKASVSSASEAVFTGGTAKIKGGKIEIN